jgi:L-threonylcarbamoyladenylate synthase
MQRSYPQYLDSEDEQKAITLWNAGELVAIPTETVYGLAADAESDLAVARIYSMKSRPSFNPLIIHVASLEIAQKYARWNDVALHLAQKFWPGALTLVLPTCSPTSLSTLALAGGDTVALRCPAHPVARQLLAKFRRGLAAPSANKSGRVSPTTAQHVRDEFGDGLFVIDGGACEVGLESTVLDLTGDVPVILRPGAVTRAMIEEVAGQPLLPPQAGGGRGGNNTANSSPGEGILKSPGQLASHYAPSIPVRLNATDVAGDEALLAFGPTPLTGAAETLNLSASGNLVEAAANLFAHLRTLDDARFRAIAVMPIPSEGLGEAINDRLRRAGV